MEDKVRTYYEIETELKTNYPKLSDFEILTLAIQIERNEILQYGLAVNRNNEKPVGLEAIAIALGYDSSRNPITIANILQQIADKDKL